jgi:hypothetical protein
VRLTTAQHERLAFLCRITQKEISHLQDTDRRLFADLFTVEAAQRIETDPILAERLDAFVSRFGRLQDNLGDKFLPQPLPDVFSAELVTFKQKIKCRSDLVMLIRQRGHR